MQAAAHALFVAIEPAFDVVAIAVIAVMSPGSGGATGTPTSLLDDHRRGQRSAAPPTSAAQRVDHTCPTRSPNRVAQDQIECDSPNQEVGDP